MTVLTGLTSALLLTALTAAQPAQRGNPPEGPADGPEALAEPDTADYIEYRCLPELGQITISDGVVRGSKAVARLSARGPELARKGVFGCVDRDKRQAYRRTDELDGRRIETLVMIAPPAGEEDDWRRRVTVRVDGRKKVDCSIGFAPDGEVFVYGVTIFPEDGTVHVVATDMDGTELAPPVEFESLDDPGVITDETLLPLPDEPAEQAKPDTEKV